MATVEWRYTDARAERFAEVAAVLASVPISILYFIGQRFVVQGLAAGAVKG